ncbi:MAG TPA: protein translocase subunit SecD [Patescibacteria group bacterium]|nr:protein translocase subunit SecD [Patescibacteria group bacterium]
MNKSIWIKLGIIIVLVAIFVIIDMPSGFNKIGIKKDPKLKKGLDLVGGSGIVYEADMSKIDPKDRANALSSLKDTIDRRVNALGVTEPLIQTRNIGDTQGLVVELPGIKDVNEAIKLIGQTANLEFKEVVQTDKGVSYVKTDLSGRHLKKATAQIDEQGNPEIAIEFNAEGTKIFSELTKENLQKPIAIFLDNELLSAPTVQTQITDGKAVITGKFSIAEAKKLVLELNAGALPVPVKIVEQKNVGATLGQDSVKMGLLAAGIGLIAIVLFMLIYYKLAGLAAVLALGIYTLLVFGIFKLSSFTPAAITLTLPGLAAFVLSIGMAVDANILIFERTKEELRNQKSILTAIDSGFQRAWPSIRDSNLSSIITAIILFWLGIGSIKGFAVTLGVGIIISMFTAITITRTFLQLLGMTCLKNKISWFV